MKKTSEMEIGETFEAEDDTGKIKQFMVVSKEVTETGVLVVRSVEVMPDV